MAKKERFSVASNEIINDLKERSKNLNTVKSTINWIRVYRDWAVLRDHNPKIEEILEESLDAVLQSFYAEIKKKNGQDYEPSCLAAMQAAIDRHLKESGCKFSILRDRQFFQSRAVLDGKAKLLRQKGMGKKPNRACSLTKDEEEVLWNCGQLGNSTPHSLSNTIWYQTTQHFGKRGRQEQYEAEVTDFIFKKDDFGNEYITFSEGITKTRQSGLHEKVRLTIPKMFENKTARCPVSMFKLYLSKRPLPLQSSGFLFLSPITNPTSNVTWYKNTRMSQNMVNSIMERMMQLPT